jgi:ABC-type dipeptide/oligopeptide/nickel transport system ATPase component
VNPQSDRYAVALGDGSTETLAPGASLALVGARAEALVQAFAEQTAAALLLADPADALHAGFAVADQIAAVFPGTRRAALDRATDLLELVGVPEPHHRVRARPHQLGRLDRQRVQLALVLAATPALIVAEDPTAGLDETEAAAFATLLGRLHVRLGFTLVVCTQQLEAAGRLVDEIIVLNEHGAMIERRRRRRPRGAPGSGAQSSPSST